MPGERLERRLAAVLAGAIEDYSRPIHADEEAILIRLKAVRKTIVAPSIASHRGRIVKTVGDSMLVEFASAADAARCAIQVQQAMAAQNSGNSQDAKLDFRIGLHDGDVIVDENDIFGECVNIAARLQSLAGPGDLCISDDIYRQIRGKVEFIGEDLGPQRLKNITEPVRAWRVSLDVRKRREKSTAATIPPALAGDEPRVLELPIKPSIAVLPFKNMSDDPEQDYFADGLVEDIIMALSRFKSLFVIARNSSFAYRGKTVDFRQVGRELGVRYLLEGSVRKAGERLRITGQLVDAAKGTQLWAEKFEGPTVDVFELQDQVASSVAGVIDPLLLDTEIRRAVTRPTSDLTAYHLYLRAAAYSRLVARRQHAGDHAARAGGGV